MLGTLREFFKNHLLENCLVGYTRKRGVGAGFPVGLICTASSMDVFLLTP